MYATHYAQVAPEFEWRMNDGAKVHVEYSADRKERGAFVQDGLLCVSGLYDPE